jgi:hypothetical protein
MRSEKEQTVEREPHGEMKAFYLGKENISRIFPLNLLVKIV